MYSVLLRFLSQFFKNNLSRIFYRIFSAAWILPKMVFCLLTNCKMHWRKQVETNTVYALENRCWTLCVQWPKTEHRGIHIIFIYLHKMFTHCKYTVFTVCHGYCTQGLHLNEEILNLMIVRYGGATEHVSLEGFICLVIRLNCMASE